MPCKPAILILNSQFWHYYLASCVAAYGALGQWRRQTRTKIQLCGSESDERTPSKSEWNTRSRSLWEDRGTAISGLLQKD